ncbi:MAG TPA: OmpA family protein [Candidatus Binatia bacterium]|jgi:outer membrane protein OmpA-like peptidoglycan-associated protein
MVSNSVLGKRFAVLLVALPVLLLQGCLATQDWVREQLTPTESRVGKLEGQLEQMTTRMAATENRLTSAEGRISQVDAKVDEVNSKADKALNSVANLRLERKLLLDLKDGAFYASNSTVLTAQGKHNIDVFLSDIKSDFAENSNVVLVVAGYTDNTGTPEYNYELGLLRAKGIMKYLTLEKNVNPARVSSVSYGATAPVGDNSTAQGREQNRRVEIRVYTESITTGADTSAAQPPAARTAAQAPKAVTVPETAPAPKAP